jgi:ABC-2 type transport system permease protein
MILFHRQFKKSLKELVIWTVCIAGLIALMVGQFRAMGSGVSTDSYSEQFKAAMGLNKVDMNTFLGYYAIKASIMATLFGGIYAAILGSGLIVKDESLLARPVSRSRIVLERYLAGAANLLFLNVAVAGIALVGESSSVILWIALGQFLLHLIFFSLGVLTAVIKLRSRTAMILPIGIVLITYVLSIIYGISEKLSFIKYLTPFWYTDAKEIINNAGMSFINIVIAVIFILGFTAAGYAVYTRRDLPA